MEETKTNKRYYPRASIKSTVNFKKLGENNTSPINIYNGADAIDISRGGIKLRTYTGMNKGDILLVDIPMAGRIKNVNAICEVRWTGRDSEGQMAGLSFMSINKEDCEVIESFVAARRKLN